MSESTNRIDGYDAINAAPATSTPGAISKSSSVSNLDDAYQIFKESGALLDVAREEHKRTLRKIDRRIVPILFFTYMLQYLDKNSINFAATFGLKEGTHIDGPQYSWLGKLSPPLYRLFARTRQRWQNNVCRASIN